MSRGLILAVDGGSTKTDVALVSAAGTVLGAARGPGIPYADIGIEAAIARLDATVAACFAGGRAAARACTAYRGSTGARRHT